MENPINFDICCKPIENCTKAVAEWTAKIHDISIHDAIKSVRFAIKRDGYIQVFIGCGWDDLSELREQLPNFVDVESCVVTQASYSPATCNSYCDKHKLLYVTQECPVCSGFYISRVVSGMSILNPNYTSKEE